MTADSPLIVALDTADPARLDALAGAVAPHVGLVKVGLQAYIALGPRAVSLARAHAPVFLDLKLHDIPNTVAGAAAAAAELGIEMLTVHASGSPAMVGAAVKAAPDVAVLAVTVLTSIDDDELALMGQPPAAEQVPRLARMAVETGAAGVVCSPHEIEAVREAVGPDALIVVPGVRPVGSAVHDQARTANPAHTIAAGATHLVIGRPITQAADPGAACLAILEELS